MAFIGAKKQPLYSHGISPNKLMDYMMSSTPIISAIGAGNDPVTEAGCGITIAPENPDSLADAIMSLCAKSDADLYAMGVAGNLFARKNYSYEVLASKFLNAMGNN